MQSPHPDIIRRIDIQAISQRYREAAPTHFFAIDGFLQPEFAQHLAASFPSFQGALDRGGKEFTRVNERVKVQLTDASRFSVPAARLHEALASPEWLELLSGVTGIENLHADPELKGGGLHLVGPGGGLGVHADFNFLEKRRWFRRLNILVYLTPDWDEEWGGDFELWDPEVRELREVIPPRFNCCMVFNTTRTSFHGVRTIRCPEGVTRNAFAAFYYTEEPPEGWNGEYHSTIYRARPGEWRKRFVEMPLDRAAFRMRHAWRAARRLRRRVGRS